MTDNSHDTAKCYIGRCKCGAIVAATVADPPSEVKQENIVKWQRRVAKDVAEFIREGLTIEQKTVEEVRSQFGNCTCPKPEKTAKQSKQQGKLFEEDKVR